MDTCNAMLSVRSRLLKVADMCDGSCRMPMSLADVWFHSNGFWKTVSGIAVRFAKPGCLPKEEPHDAMDTQWHKQDDTHLKQPQKMKNKDKVSSFLKPTSMDMSASWMAAGSSCFVYIHRTVVDSPISCWEASHRSGSSICSACGICAQNCIVHTLEWMLHPSSQTLLGSYG